MFPKDVVCSNSGIKKMLLCTCLLHVDIFTFTVWDTLQELFFLLETCRSVATCRGLFSFVFYLAVSPGTHVVSEYSFSKNKSKETLYSMMFFIPTSSWMA